MRILMVTSEWPTHKHPNWVPFLVQQVRYLRKAGVEVEVFSFRGNQNPINYFKAWVQLRRRYELKRFDLIHAEFGQSGLLALPIQIPLVVTLHGSDLQGLVGPHGRYTARGSILKSVSQYVARRAQEIIVVSDHLIRFLPDSLRVNVIPCGIDLELFQPLPKEDARHQLKMPLNRLFVLFVANPLNPIKRFHLAEEAMSLLPPHLNAELLTLVGISHDQVPLYMNACDALVLTSKHEGSPSVIKEALACNLPIVSVNVGDVWQRLDGVNGCVVCADDSPLTIARGLAEVLQHHRLTDGRATVMELDEGKLVENIIEVYRSAINSNSH